MQECRFFKEGDTFSYLPLDNSKLKTSRKKKGACRAVSHPIVCCFLPSTPVPTSQRAIIALVLTALTLALGSVAGPTATTRYMMTLRETVLYLVGTCFYYLHKEDNTTGLIGLLKEIKEIVM